MSYLTQYTVELDLFEQTLNEQILFHVSDLLYFRMFHACFIFWNTNLEKIHMFLNQILFETSSEKILFCIFDSFFLSKYLHVYTDTYSFLDNNINTSLW